MAFLYLGLFIVLPVAAILERGFGDGLGNLRAALDTFGAVNALKLTITMAASDYLDMVNGKLNPQMAFMSGKLKIAGDMGLAMKMQQLFPMG